jgi:hypothetical protein
MKKGDTVYGNGYPAILLETPRSTNPYTPILCAVFGIEVDFGSVYFKDIQPVSPQACYGFLTGERLERFKKVEAEYKKKQAKAEAKKLRQKQNTKNIS